MSIVIEISNQFKMWKILLTCFKSNCNAISFYKSVGFDIDSNSPSKHGMNDECYEILSNKPKLK